MLANSSSALRRFSVLWWSLEGKAILSDFPLPQQVRVWLGNDTFWGYLAAPLDWALLAALEVLYRDSWQQMVSAECPIGTVLLGHVSTAITGPLVSRVVGLLRCPIQMQRTY